MMHLSERPASRRPPDCRVASPIRSCRHLDIVFNESGPDHWQCGVCGERFVVEDAGGALAIG